jgi:hypothetical protein
MNVMYVRINDKCYIRKSIADELVGALKRIADGEDYPEYIANSALSRYEQLMKDGK